MTLEKLIRENQARGITDFRFHQLADCAGHPTIYVWASGAQDEALDFIVQGNKLIELDHPIYAGDET